MICLSINLWLPVDHLNLHPDSLAAPNGTNFFSTICTKMLCVHAVRLAACTYVLPDVPPLSRECGAHRRFVSCLCMCRCPAAFNAGLGTFTDRWTGLDPLNVNQRLQALAMLQPMTEFQASSHLLMMTC